MSTPNYCFENILVALEDEETDLWDILFLPSLQGELQKAFKDGYISDKYLNDYRSYGGHEVFVIPVLADGGQTYRRITVIVRSGYYAGANLDFLVSDCELDEAPKNASKLDALIGKFTARLKKILRRYGTELSCVGIFSNGEAVYKVKK